MSGNEIENDAALAALRVLRAYDVSSARAQRLRAECHRLLTRQATSGHAPTKDDHHAWQPALHVFAGVWCLVYLLEMFRRALVAYGLWR